MHPKNKHRNPYNFNQLKKENSSLAPYVFTNKFGKETIDFSNNEAVYHLNKALLSLHYSVPNWSLPKGYLCPPIPGRADYIHAIADLLEELHAPQQPIKVLDVGVGANCIYPILGAQLYGWTMVGIDIDSTAVTSAKQNVAAHEVLQNKVTILHQKNNAHIFEGAILPGDYFHLTMCNPPFHASEKEATRGTLRKLKNLKGTAAQKELNFGGQANELWCNGGEALFIKRMIKQSVAFKTQVGWFTTLVSKKENLTGIYKLLDKQKSIYKTIEMELGNKKSRLVAWRFQ